MSPHSSHRHSRPIHKLIILPAGANGQLTAGQRMAERVANLIGSWRFILSQASLMACWVLFNTLQVTGHLHFDQYPFVFLNLAMSAEAAFATPLLLIAANVQAVRDHQQISHIEGVVVALQRVESQMDSHLNQQDQHLDSQDALLQELGRLVAELKSTHSDAAG